MQGRWKWLYTDIYENGTPQAVITELAKYQHADGGFGHGLESDNWTPPSNPIATNDAVITLYRTGALDKDSAVVKGIVRYSALSAWRRPASLSPWC